MLITDDFLNTIIIIISMKRFLSLFIACLILAAPAYSWGWFKKSKEEPKSENVMDNPGYKGTLPKLNKNYETKEEKVVTPIYESDEDFTDPAALKPIPRSNPAFVNIILKSDKSSDYLNNVNDMITYVEKLIDSIENNESDQLFIAKARIFKFKVDNLKRMYNGKSESYYPGYKKLQQTGAHTDAIATLREEAVTYKKYLAYQTTGSVYNPANIAQQLEYLLSELQDTLMILKEER